MKKERMLSIYFCVFSRVLSAINKRDDAPRKSAYATNPDGFIPITLDIP